jgi:hypothetical protein
MKCLEVKLLNSYTTIWEREMAEKPTLMQLRKEYNKDRTDILTSKQLAKDAGVPLADEFQMEIGGWVSRENAIKILRAFSIKVGKQYTLNDVAFRLKTLCGRHGG